MLHEWLWRICQTKYCSGFTPEPACRGWLVVSTRSSWSNTNRVAEIDLIWEVLIQQELWSVSHLLWRCVMNSNISVWSDPRDIHKPAFQDDSVFQFYLLPSPKLKDIVKWCSDVAQHVIICFLHSHTNMYACRHTQRSAELDWTRPWPGLVPVDSAHQIRLPPISWDASTNTRSYPQPSEQIHTYTTQCETHGGHVVYDSPH